MDQTIGSGLGHLDVGLSEVGRRCSRPLCARVADVVLLFDYGARHVALDWGLHDHDPNHLELCFEHAETFGPPQGWTLDDRRAESVVATRDVEAVAR